MNRPDFDIRLVKSVLEIWQNEIGLPSMELTIAEYIEIITDPTEDVPPGYTIFTREYQRRQDRLMLVRRQGVDFSYELFCNAIQRYEHQFELNRRERLKKQLPWRTFTVTQESVFVLFSQCQSIYQTPIVIQDAAILNGLWNHYFRTRLDSQQIQTFPKCIPLFPNMTSVLLIAEGFMNFVQNGMNGNSYVHFLIHTDFGKKQNQWPAMENSYEFTRLEQTFLDFGSWTNLFGSLVERDDWQVPHVCLIEIDRQTDIRQSGFRIHNMSATEFEEGLFGREGSWRAVQYTKSDWIWLYGTRCCGGIPAQAFLGLGGRRIQLESGKQVVEVLERFAEYKPLRGINWRGQTREVVRRNIRMGSDANDEALAGIFQKVIR